MSQDKLSLQEKTQLHGSREKQIFALCRRKRDKTSLSAPEANAATWYKEGTKQHLFKYLGNFGGNEQGTFKG